ncbi:anaphase promoting complex subunit CDC16 [Sugiyamaella lignohabitans]|uniref:Anaphase promoting complex subunit CDC16 n=1 Tax=Sugiyamaella lignohabitans TaxID=796027 RepID=A0A167DTR8_9ASCO|nr:anaphase promoting complex subunit CDC16 [Sugiyamaella lignohabitans]ANB13281.1 anaphase promoting complex subunit CDC16 [Sugiyamaella lignohabitans]
MRLGSNGSNGTSGISRTRLKNSSFKTDNGSHSAGKALSQVDTLRQWRQDALMKHQYKTAEFVGDKVLTLTADMNDAYWLAKIHFTAGNYGRAHNVLVSQPHWRTSLQYRYLAGLSLCNMGKWDQALDIVGESNDQIIALEKQSDSDNDDLTEKQLGITGSLEAGKYSSNGGNSETRKSSEEISGNYSQVGTGQEAESLTPASHPESGSALGPKGKSTIAISSQIKPPPPPSKTSASVHSLSSIPFSSSSSAAAARAAIPLQIRTTSEQTYPTSSSTSPSVNPLTLSPTNMMPESSDGIKIEASLCFLRGQIYTNDNNFDKAKECYREAVKIDAKCYEAFDELVTNNLMTPQEEWDFLKSLDFEGSAGSGNAELVKALYSIRLGKYINLAEYKEAHSLLTDYYGLGENPDILLSQADALLTQNRHRECLHVCEKILSHDKFKFAALPNYLACLYELGSRNRLFQLAHELVASSPQEAVSWQAVGVYYMVINKISEARRYFSKASMMNPYFAPAWVGFAHTFAAEKEHEQAISAYSTAARLFPGSHLPTLFLGMQHLQLGNVTLADDYLATSYNVCKTDPLLLNEMGVVYYEKREYERAESFFLKALEVASDLESDPKSWLAIKSNLGHVYRRQENFDKSLTYFEEVLRVSPKDPGIHTSMGLVNLMASRTMLAIENFNDALSLSPGDPITSDLLKKALQEHSRSLELATVDDRFLFQDPDLQDLVDLSDEDSLENDEGDQSGMELE